MLDIALISEYNSIIRREQESRRKHGPKGRNNVGDNRGKGAARESRPRTTEALLKPPRHKQHQNDMEERTMSINEIESKIRELRQLQALIDEA